MKRLFLTTFALLALAHPASASSGSQPVGQPSKLYYFEVLPKQQLKLEFSSKKACPNPVHFDRFESVQNLPSTETGESIPVRVIQLYAKSSSACSVAPSGLSQIAVKLGQDSKMMTHIYLTADTELELKAH